MAVTLGDIISVIIDVELDRLTAGLQGAKTRIKTFSSEVQKEGTALFQRGATGILGPGWADARKQIQENSEKIMSAANRMSLTAMRTILAGGAALAVAFFPTKEAVEFEKALSLVAGVSRATGNELNDLREIAIQMGRDTIYSATEAAQAMVLLAKAGFTVHEITAMLPAVMQLAAAGELSIAEAADVAASAIHGFNLAARDMAHVSDVLALSANVSSISVKDIAESLKYVAPAATAAGMGIDDVGAALAVLGNAGIRGSMAGTTLRQILIRLTEDSQKFSDAFANMGISIFDAQGKIRPFIDIMGQMAERQVSFSQATSVFTARSASGAIALIQNIDALKKFAFENRNAAGESKRLSDILLNNVAGSLQYLKSSIASVSIAVAGPLLGGFKMLIDILGQLFNTMQRVASWAPFEILSTTVGYLIGSLSTVLALLGSIAAIVLTPVLGPLVALSGAMGVFLLAMGGAGIIVSGFLRTIMYLADSTTILSGETLKAAVSQRALAIAATPLGGIFMQIGAAAKAAVNAIWANGMWTVIGLAIGAVAVTFYILLTATRRAAESSAKAASEATALRKEFEELGKALLSTAVGTAEHDRVLAELIKKYPELAGRIKAVNQSLEEQREIIENFKTVLMQRELEKAQEAMRKSLDYLRDLTAEQEAFTKFAMTPEELWEMAPPELDVDPSILVRQQERILKSNEQVRESYAKMRMFIQTQLDSIDWKKAGQKPLDMYKATHEEFQKFVNSNDVGIRRIADYWRVYLGLSMENVWELMQLITKEYRDQERLAGAARGPFTPIRIDLREARNAVDRILGEVKRELPHLTTQLSIEGIEEDTAQMAELRERMLGIIPALTDLGAAVRKHFQDEMLKSIKIAKEMGSSTEEVFEALRIKMLVVSKTWSDFVGSMSEKRAQDLVQFMPTTGGVDFEATARRYKIAVADMSTVQNTINNLVKQYPMLSQAMITAVLAQESRFDQLAISYKGAIGYMQLMPETAMAMGISFGKTKEEVKALVKEYQAMFDSEGKLLVSKDTLKAAQAKYRQELAAGFDAVANITGGVKYLNQGMEENIGRTDQWARALARYSTGGSDNLRTASKYIDEVNQRMAEGGKKVGFFVFDEMRAKQDAKLATDTIDKIESARQRGAMSTNEAIAQQWSEVYKKANAEVAAAQANLADVRLKDPYDLEKIKAATDEVINAQLKGEKDIRDFVLRTARERAHLVELEIKNRLEVLRNEIAAAERVYQLHEAEAEARKAAYAAQLEMGAITGTEYAGLVIKQENELFREQLDILNKRLESIRSAAALEMLAIDARAAAQTVEETNAQRAAVRNALERETLDVTLKIGEAIANNTRRTAEWANEAARARKELSSIAIEELSKLAWGPIQERAAQLLRNAKEYADLAERIGRLPVPAVTGPEGLIKPLEADPNLKTMINDMLEAARMLNSPWAEPLALIVAELAGVMSPERFAAIKEKLKLEIIPELKEEAAFKIKYKEQIEAAAKSVKDGIENLVIGILEGGKDLRKAAQDMFKNLFKAGIMDGMKWLEQQLKDAFAALFKSVGASVGMALMTVIGLIGMMLLKSTESSFTPSGATTGITSHEAVRGIIAGETTIPIAKISESLAETTAPHLFELRKANQYLAKISEMEINPMAAVAALEAFLEQYFAGKLQTAT